MVHTVQNSRGHADERDVFKKSFRLYRLAHTEEAGQGDEYDRRKGIAHKVRSELKSDAHPSTRCCNPDLLAATFASKLGRSCRLGASELDGRDRTAPEGRSKHQQIVDDSRQGHCCVGHRVRNSEREEEASSRVYTVSRLGPDVASQRFFRRGESESDGAHLQCHSPCRLIKQTFASFPDYSAQHDKQNSKTAMIAAISPADYEETLSTLRYADQAKKIQNKAVVNEDANAKLVRELQEELAMLRARVAGSTQEATYDPSIHPEKQIVQFKTSTGEIRTVTKAELQEQLEQSEKLMTEVNQTWEEKVQKTEMIQREREQALQDLGIVIEKGNVGVHTPKKMPHLVNLCEDPLMSE